MPARSTNAGLDSHCAPYLQVAKRGEPARSAERSRSDAGRWAADGHRDRGQRRGSLRPHNGANARLDDSAAVGKPDHLRRKGRRESHVDYPLPRRARPFTLASVSTGTYSLGNQASSRGLTTSRAARSSASSSSWTSSETRAVAGRNLGATTGCSQNRARSNPFRCAVGSASGRPRWTSPRSRRLVARNSSLGTGARCTAHPPARPEGRHSDSAAVHDGDSDRAGLTGVLQ